MGATVGATGALSTGFVCAGHVRHEVLGARQAEGVEEDEEWADWYRATFTPLSEADAALAEHLLGRLVDRFLAVAGLSSSHREEALQQASIELGLTPAGIRILRGRLPLGEGRPEYEWDGSTKDAEEIIDSMADAAGDNVVAERPIVGPTE
jgi:hypothetical protein